ncbi:hypothetical protein BD309DRAFT_1006082, partial [Dichomitus squalens]
MVRLRGSSGISHLRALLHLDCDKRKRTHSKLAEFFMIPAPLAAYVDASPLNGVRVTIEAKAKFRVWTSLSALEKLGHASASNCDQTPSHAEEARGPGMREDGVMFRAHPEAHLTGDSTWEASVADSASLRLLLQLSHLSRSRFYARRSSSLLPVRRRIAAHRIHVQSKYHDLRHSTSGMGNYRFCLPRLNLAEKLPLLQGTCKAGLLKMVC